MLENIINNLSGFEVNRHGDCWDHHVAAIRIYQDDNELVVVKFNSMKIQAITWRSVLDMNMGEDLVVKTIDTMGYESRV